MKELEIIEKIELYLEGKLQDEERHRFEELLNNDKEIRNLFLCHKKGIETEIHMYAKSCSHIAKTTVTKNSII
jgi:hypothetical protein